MVRAWVGVVAVCLVLAGCGGLGGPKVNPVADVQPATLKASGKAVIIFSGSLLTKGMWELDTPAYISWGKPFGSVMDTVQDGVSSGSGDTIDSPMVKVVTAQEFSLLSFMAKVGNTTYSNGSAIYGLPLAGASLAPGEVVYIGHAQFLDKPSAMFSGKQASFGLRVLDGSAKARAYLATLSPALAQQMTVRFMKPSAMLESQ
jgi:hypothetical protein